MSARAVGRGTGTLYKPTYKARNGTKRTSGIWRWKLGDRINLSTGCRNLALAEAWRLERLSEMGRGWLVGLRAAALRYEDLERMLLDAHALEGRRCHPESELRHLRRAFGGWLAQDITPAACREYAARRRADGYAVATVNLHLARLRRALRLAWQSGRLPAAPYVPLLPGARVRRGFLELGDVEAIVERLPERVRPVVRFLALTGWRLGEAVRLEWSRVDRVAQEIRLDTSKSGAPRCLPYSTYPPLGELIEEQWQIRLAAGSGTFRLSVSTVGGTYVDNPLHAAFTGGGPTSITERVPYAQSPAESHDTSPVQPSRSSGAGQPCEDAGEGRGVVAPVLYGGPAVASGLPAYCRGTEPRRPFLSPWVFPSRRSMRPLSKDTLERAWRKAADETGHVGALLHDLRRSFVRRCERVGIPRQVAMSLTGHATEAIYCRYAITDRSAQEDGLRLLAGEPQIWKVERMG